jgi:superfamily II DNA or RNA helicase
MRHRRDHAHFVPPAVVRRAIARAVLGERTLANEAVLGSVTLREHQRDAVRRLRAILQREHVALLADDVGMGKTYTALAVAQSYPQTLVIAPAALLPMWRDAIARADAREVRLTSIQRFSHDRREVEPLAATSLVIIDEAHHVRTPNTKRYRAVAELVAGCDLLLVSATPVHNTPRDLRALLALSIGARSAELDEQLLSRLIVRRSDTAERPRISRRPPLAMPHDAALLDAILALPAPLPAHDGAVAGALIRLGLLRAWCSSDAALASALRRRLLRGEALQQALEAGRHPTTVELRTWLVGEHEVQLAFPELLAAHAPESGPLLDILSRHLDAVRDVLRHVRHEVDRDRRITANDAARAERLRALMAAHDPVPIVAFSQFAETVRAVGRALADIAGVGVLTGRSAWIASGQISRQEALDCFAPDAQGRPPPPPHQRIRLLLTTDLLAEGVNLQDAGVVVHLDLPWTSALRRQRVGRCARVGSKHPDVIVYEFAPPSGAESVLRLYARLARKAQLSNVLVGSARPAAGDGSQRARYSAAEAATAVRDMVRRWAGDDIDAVADPPTGQTIAAPSLVAFDVGAFNGGIALVTDGRGTSHLVALEFESGAESAFERAFEPAFEPQCDLEFDVNGAKRQVVRITRSPRRVLRVLQRCSAAAMVRRGATAPSLAREEYGGKPGDVVRPSWSRVVWPSVWRALRRWCRRRSLGAELGDESLLSAPHRRALASVREHVRALSPAQRILVRRDVQDALAMVFGVRGAAGEDALRRWTSMSRSPSAGSSHGWLNGWKAFPALNHAGVGNPDDALPRPYRVLACLVMRRRADT